MSDIEKPWVERRRSGPPSSCPVCGAATMRLSISNTITCRAASIEHFEWRPDAGPVVSVESERADKTDYDISAGQDPLPQADLTDSYRRIQDAVNDAVRRVVATGAFGTLDYAPSPLAADEVAELAEGTKVTVIWSGGNGPHDYFITVAPHGERYAWNGGDVRLRFHNPLRFVGQERFHTRVWLRDNPPATAPDVHIPGCPALNYSGDCTCAPLEGELMGRDFVETAERRLHPDAAALASLHRPVYGRPPYCWACSSAGRREVRRVGTERRATWPCSTASLALEMMKLTPSDIAITEE